MPYSDPIHTFSTDNFVHMAGNNTHAGGKKKDGFRKLSEISSEELNDVAERIIAVRSVMLQRCAFFGIMAIGLRLTFADWLDTAATDGERIYFHPDFVKTLDNRELMFVVAHEVGHVYQMALQRKGDRDHKLWNYALDYVINNMLVEAKVGKMPSIGLLDAKYSDQSVWGSEEVYDDLLEQCEKNGGSCSADSKGTLDEHLDGDSGDGDDESNGGGDDSDGDGGITTNQDYDTSTSRPKQNKSESEQENLEQKIRQKLMDAAQKAANSKQAGHIPAGVKEMIDQLENPLVDWRSYIDATLKTFIESDYTYTRPADELWSMSDDIAALPTTEYEDSINVAYIIDSSGSVPTSDLIDAISEFAGMLDQFTSFNVRIWQFDTEIYAYKEFDENNADEIKDYNIAGRGGTYFNVNWEFMKEKEIEPDVVIFCTDGYPCDTDGWFPKYEFNFDLIYLIFGDTTRSIKAPDPATTLHYSRTEGGVLLPK